MNLTKSEVWFPELSINKLSFSDDGRIYFVYDNHRKLAYYELGGDTTEITNQFNEVGINYFIDLIIDTTSVIVAGNNGQLATYVDNIAAIEEDFNQVEADSITSLAFNSFTYLIDTIKDELILSYISVGTTDGLYNNFDGISEFQKFEIDSTVVGFNYEGRSIVFRERLFEVYNNSRIDEFRNCFNERITRIQTFRGSIYVNSYSDTVRTNDLLSLRNNVFFGDVPHLYIASDQGLINRSWGCNETFQRIFVEGRINKLDIYNPYAAISPIIDSDFQLFAGTDNGLYFSDRDESVRANFDTFNLLENTEGAIYRDFTFNYCAAELYAATDKGIVQVKSFDNKSFIPFIGDKISPKGTIEICEGDTLTIQSGLFDNFELQWFQNGDSILDATSLSYAATEPGAYRFAINNCFFEQIQFSDELTLIPYDDVNFEWDNPDSLSTCLIADTLFLTTESGNSVVWFRDGERLTSDTTFVIINESGNYYADIINCNQFQATSPQTYVAFNALNKPIIENLDDVVCESEYGLIEFSNYESGEITWYLDGTAIDSLQNLSQFYTNQQGKYLAKVNNDFCEELSDTLLFELAPNPIYNLNGQDYFCTGESVTLNLSTDRNSILQVNGVAYQEGLSFNEETELIIDVVGPDGCTIKDTLSIFERSIPGLPIDKDTVHCFGELEPFRVSDLDPQNQYFLSEDQITDELVVSEASQISVFVLDQFGCSNEA
ncbi:MAG: hypothetical protein AAFQ94_04140 [Bacteroidota bacterium]